MADGISLVLDVGELDAAITGLAPITNFEPIELTEALAALGESQTRRRITSEKTAPDGTPWLPNRAGTSILQRTGRNLLDSVASYATDTEAVWGASWEHAHVHQEGATIVPKNAEALAIPTPDGTVFARKAVIPARPFVGLSEANRAEMLELVSDVFGLGGTP